MTPNQHIALLIVSALIALYVFIKMDGDEEDTPIVTYIITFALAFMLVEVIGWCIRQFI